MEKNLRDDNWAANFYGLAPITLRIWRSKKKGPKYIKLGRAIRYRESDLIEYLQENMISHE
jgi:predicted DNA-binding transcriptional regulator AlpA